MAWIWHGIRVYFAQEALVASFLIDRVIWPYLLPASGGRCLAVPWLLGGRCLAVPLACQWETLSGRTLAPGGRCLAVPLALPLAYVVSRGIVFEGNVATYLAWYSNEAKMLEDNLLNCFRMKP